MCFVIRFRLRWYKNVTSVLKNLTVQSKLRQNFWTVKVI